MENKCNIMPLRMIRIAKDLTLDEMANYFMVTKAYMSAIENNKREMHIRTLKFGLIEMNINLDDYLQLQEFSVDLLNSDLPDRDKYKFMLIKTLGVVSPELKIETEELLDNYYYKKAKGR